MTSTPRTLWRRWTVATAAGEVLGFAVPTLVSLAVLLVAGEPRSIGARLAFYGAMIAAGMGEGTVLGVAQATVLRRALPEIGRRWWVLATAVAAGVAWSIGLMPSTFLDPPSLPLAVILLAGIPLALILLNTIGAGQWLVLRRVLPEAGWWIPANALAWLLGLLPTFIGPALIPDGAPLVAWLAVGIVCGLLMGLIVGAVTGVALERVRDLGLVACEDEHSQAVSE